MTTLRFKMVEEAIGRKAVEVKAPAERPAEYFGKYVFERDKIGNICRKLVSKR